MTEPLDHICRICEGEPGHAHCFCDGHGVITRTRALELAADDPDPRWQPLPLPPMPEFTGKRCHDCAFKAGSDERDAMTASQLYRKLARTNKGQPFYCHQGMHHGARGYVPRLRDENGMPVGHPLCAGWVREHEKAQRGA